MDAFKHSFALRDNASLSVFVFIQVCLLRPCFFFPLWKDLRFLVPVFLLILTSRQRKKGDGDEMKVS